MTRFRGGLTCGSPGYWIHVTYSHRTSSSTHLTCTPPAATAFLPSPEDVLPGPSEQSSRRKWRLHCQRVTSQPDFGTSKQPAVVGEKDTFATIFDIGTVYAGAVCFVTEDNDYSSFPASPMNEITRTAFSEVPSQLNDCFSPAPPLLAQPV